jgi:hypothetical protein
MIAKFLNILTCLICGCVLSIAHAEDKKADRPKSLEEVRSEAREKGGDDAEYTAAVTWVCTASAEELAAEMKKGTTLGAIYSYTSYPVSSAAYMDGQVFEGAYKVVAPEVEQENEKRLQKALDALDQEFERGNYAPKDEKKS